MEVVRNIQVKLDVPEDAHSVLDETFEQFRQAAQHVADHGWDDNPYDITDTKNTLHDETYSAVRDRLSLQSSLVQSARNLAADALGNCKDRKFDGDKASNPEFRGSVVVYNGRTITYNDDSVTLATTDERVTAEFVTPVTEEGTPFEDYWTDEWETREATLHKRDGTYYLHVAVMKEVEPSCDDDSENGVVLGVDLNVEGYLAVTSTGAFFGNADYLNTDATSTNVVAATCNRQALAPPTSPSRASGHDSLGGVPTTSTVCRRQSFRRPLRTTARRLPSRI